MATFFSSLFRPVPVIVTLPSGLAGIGAKSRLWTGEDEESCLHRHWAGKDASSSEPDPADEYRVDIAAENKGGGRRTDKRCTTDTSAKHDGRSLPKGGWFRGHGEG